MARIFYSMSGHGRGHATRVRAVVDELRHEHELFLYCPGDAYDYLREVYEGTAVRVIELVPCIRLEYIGDHVSIPKTIWHGARYLTHLPRNINWLREEIQRHQPDLALVDLEAALPRAARKERVPCIAIDNHHRFVVYDSSQSAWWLRLYALVIGMFVRITCPAQHALLVSAFHHMPVKRRFLQRNLHLIGPLLRKSVLAAQPRRGDDLIAYLRESMPPNVLQALRDCGERVRVYGLGERPAEGQLTYHALSDGEFVEELARCRAVISTAGHQLIAEAIHFGKPCLVMPEIGHIEQQTNADVLDDCGGGIWTHARQLSAELLRDFLENADRYRPAVPEPGNMAVRRIVNQYLAQIKSPRPEFIGKPSSEPAVA